MRPDVSLGSVEEEKTVSQLASAPEEYDFGLFEILDVLRSRWRQLVGGAFLAGVTAFGIASLTTPTFTARTTLLPPQQQQSAASAALAQLGALAAFSGAGAGLRTPADQYIALLQSNAVLNGLVEAFNLVQRYEVEFTQDARAVLAKRSRISVGKKDGLITIEVDDPDPVVAAHIANAYVEGLRLVSKTLAVTEAQQRRRFFEEQLLLARDRLTKAQIALQQSGFNQGALSVEPKAAAESYAKLQSEAVAAELRLRALSEVLNDQAPEVLKQRSIIEGLKRQLASVERRQSPKGDSDYVTRYREFKYSETLFDLFARQYEAARVDEIREGTLIQVLDPAVPPKRKSGPKRAAIAVVSAVMIGSILAIWVVLSHLRRTTIRRRSGIPTDIN